jgi:hypothetical protein
MNATLVTDSFAGCASSLGNAPANLPEDQRGKHIPGAGVQNGREVLHKRTPKLQWVADRRDDDKPHAECRKGGSDGESGDSDELTRLHTGACDRILRSRTVQFQHRAAVPGAARPLIAE